MTGDVQDGGRLAGRGCFGDVEIAGDVESRHALEDEVFDAVAGALEAAGDFHAQRRARGQGVEAEHEERLAVDFRAASLPVRAAGNAVELAICDGLGAEREVVLEQLVALGWGMAARAAGGLGRQGGGPK